MEKHQSVSDYPKSNTKAEEASHSRTKAATVRICLHCLIIQSMCHSQSSVHNTNTYETTSKLV